MTPFRKFIAAEAEKAGVGNMAKKERATKKAKDFPLIVLRNDEIRIILTHKIVTIRPSDETVWQFDRKLLVRPLQGS